LDSKTIRVFNKDCDRKLWDQCHKPRFLYFKLLDGKTYKESFQASFDNAGKEEVELLLKLPNFDYDVFEEISGISKEMINAKMEVKSNDI
jgi:hypothetical protein